MSRSRSQGFVLVLVLAMLVVLSLLAGGIAAVTARLATQAQDRAWQMQDDIDMASTRATVMYLLSTQRLTIGGLTVDRRGLFGADGVRQVEADEDRPSMLPVGNEIAFDDRAYRGLGETRFAVQDDSGLYGVDWHPAPTLARLLAQGSRTKTLPETLINRLTDYQDKDDLYRLNSAEAEGYREAGLPPPTNLPLATPMELRRVMGWGEALDFLSTSELVGTISVHGGVPINVNTAPPRVLRTLIGVDADMAARVVARRKLQPFLTEGTFSEFLGLPGSLEAPITVYPATSGSMSLWSVRGGQAALMHWTLTPFDDKGRPWREDYELNHSQDRVDNGAALPVASRLFAKPVAARH